MKKYIAIIMCFILAFSLSACGGKDVPVPALSKTADVGDANQYITEFFASYTKMCDYISSPELELSSFTLHSATLDFILKPLYQEKVVTYKFTTPVQVSENVFTTTVTVTSADMAPICTIIDLDVNNATEAVTPEFVQKLFLENMSLIGVTPVTTENIALTMRYTDGTWTIVPSNELVNAIFPNIKTAQ